MNRGMGNTVQWVRAALSLGYVWKLGQRLALGNHHIEEIRQDPSCLFEITRKFSATAAI